MNRQQVFPTLGVRHDDPRYATELINAAGKLILEAEAALDMFDETVRLLARGDVSDIQPNLPYWLSRVQMAGKAFVATLARLGRVLSTLGTTDPRYAGLWEEFKKALPAITDARDSHEHIEDRARGLRRVKHWLVPIVRQDPSDIVMSENIVGTEYTTLLEMGRLERFTFLRDRSPWRMPSCSGRSICMQMLAAERKGVRPLVAAPRTSCSAR